MYDVYINNKHKHNKSYTNLIYIYKVLYIWQSINNKYFIPNKYTNTTIHIPAPMASGRSLRDWVTVL